ncbi:MAG TPA: T9SS type A sorting domain-containing protein [Bacteroidia bacterium]
MKKTLLNLIGFSLIALTANKLEAQAPVADFETCTRVVIQYNSVKLTDLSTNTPFQWTWNLYDSLTYAGSDYYPSLATGEVIADPFSNGSDEFSKNPEFSFDVVGCYTVVLTAKNNVGNSVPKRKTCYIKVVKPFEFHLGFGTYGEKFDNKIKNDYGIITDDGGMNLNYGNNQGAGTKSYLKIVPAVGLNPTIKFRQVRLSAGDSLRIYDADTVVSGKLLAVVKSSMNGTYPSYSSTSGKMFVLFESNASGTDSGYIAEFLTAMGTPIAPVAYYTHTSPSIGFQTVFVNQYRSDFRWNYITNWYVNDTLQTGFVNKDTFLYTFMNSNTHKVTLTLTGCDSTFSYSKTFSPNSNIDRYSVNTGSFIVYPNPGSSILNLVNTSGIQHFGAELYDITGASMIKIPIGVENIDISNIACGVYFIKIETLEGSQVLKFQKL